jgi:hypothetical protein
MSVRLRVISPVGNLVRMRFHNHDRFCAGTGTPGIFTLTAPRIGQGMGAALHLDSFQEQERSANPDRR